MNLSIIIPNYNGQDLLNKNLLKVAEALSSYRDGEMEMIVADDCSTDNSIEVLKNLGSKIKSLYLNIKFKIVKSEKNLGFSSNVNKGAENAKGEILILLNTDVSPKKDSLIPLISHFSDSNIFAVGCMDESIEGKNVILRGRGIGGWKRGFFVHSRGEVDRTNTLWVGGGSGAFRKSIWKKLGGFDSLYNPFYWEDIDLSYRALKSGYKILFERKSVVTHEHEKGSIKSTYSNFKVKTIAYRNQFIFVWKNSTDLNLQLSHLFWLPYHFLTALLRWDLNFFVGFFLAFLRLPKIIGSSFRAKKYFIKSDSAVVKEFAR